MTDTDTHQRRIGWQSWTTIGVFSALLIGGTTVGINAAQNAAAEVAQQHLLASVKTESVTMQAASDDDAAVMADVNQTAAVDHTNEVAAAAEAARKAAEEAAAAAAAKAAADAAAAQTAHDAAARQQSSSSSDDDSGPVRCPAGSQANSGDGGNDTSCFPVICFHIQLPDPNHPECVTPFKP